MKWFKHLVTIVFLSQMTSVSIGLDYDEPLPLNPIESIFNFIIRFIDIPGINLNPDGKYEEVVTIDYRGSFEKAMGQIKLYRSYVDCIKKTESIPMPRMRPMSRESTDAELINAYGEYVDKVIEYLSAIRMACSPPLVIKLPAYKKN